MPWSLTHSPERRLIIQRFWGELELSEIADVRAERLRRGIVAPEDRCLTDVRGAKFLFTPFELKVREADTTPMDVAARRMAILSTDAVPTAMSMFWAKVMGNKIEVEVFSTEAAAYAWLGIEPSDGDLAAR